jgi:hypothetical protein
MFHMLPSAVPGLLNMDMPIVRIFPNMLAAVASASLFDLAVALILYGQYLCRGPGVRFSSLVTVRSGS